MTTIASRVGRVIAVAASAAAITMAVPTITAVSAAMLDHATPVTGYAVPAVLPPCVNEDGSGGPVPCLWNARTMGNGQGRSFVVTVLDLRG